jgi:hypothetical protein
MMELLTWVGEHPVLSVVLLIVFFEGLGFIIRAFTQ